MVQFESLARKLPFLIGHVSGVRVPGHVHVKGPQNGQQQTVHQAHEVGGPQDE
jgi:hypothetical protein